MLIFLQLTLTEIYGLARCYIFSKQFSVEYIETVNGSNAIGRISRSDFDQGHRVLSNSSVKFKFDNRKTTIGLSTKELKDHRLVMFIMIEETCCKTFSSSALIFVVIEQILT
jgi:hypothetical protein